MHIGIFSNLLKYPSTGTGGVERWAILLANAFSKQGHRVTILANSPWRRCDSCHELETNVAVERLGKSGTLATLMLAWWMRRNRGALVLSASPRYNLMTARAQWLARRSAFCVLSAHEHMTRTLSDVSPRRRAHRARDVGRWYPQADAVVAVSRAAAADLVECWGVPRERCCVIYNPVVMPPSVGSPAPHEWLADKRIPCLVGAGRLTPQKGFDVLLNALSRLQQRGVRCRLLLCGDGPERDRLQALQQRLGLADSVRFVGHVDGLGNYLASARLFVLSSRSEGLPYVLIEALAAGVDCVATDCMTGPREILEDGRYGRLVPPESADALADAIRASLQEAPSDPAPLRARAEAFSPEIAVASYLDLFSELMEDGAVCRPAATIRCPPPP